MEKKFFAPGNGLLPPFSTALLKLFRDILQYNNITLIEQKEYNS